MVKISPALFKEATLTQISIYKSFVYQAKKIIRNDKYMYIVKSTVIGNKSLNFQFYESF